MSQLQHTHLGNVCVIDPVSLHVVDTRVRVSNDRRVRIPRPGDFVSRWSLEVAGFDDVIIVPEGLLVSVASRESWMRLHHSIYDVEILVLWFS